MRVDPSCTSIRRRSPRRPARKTIGSEPWSTAFVTNSLTINSDCWRIGVARHANASTRACRAWAGADRSHASFISSASRVGPCTEPSVPGSNRVKPDPDSLSQVTGTLESVDPDGADSGTLDRFSAPVRAWFETSFAAPTDAQAAGWPAIAARDHTLILAPTGFETLATEIWNSTTVGFYERGAIPSLVLLIVATPALFLLTDRE